MSNLSQTANGSMGVGVTGGAIGTGLSLADVIASNAILITVSCTVIGLLIGLFFHIVNSVINQRRTKIQEESAKIQAEAAQLQRAKQIDEWVSQGKTHEEIESILNLAKEFS